MSASSPLSEMYLRHLYNSELMETLPLRGLSFSSSYSASRSALLLLRPSIRRPGSAPRQALAFDIAHVLPRELLLLALQPRQARSPCQRRLLYKLCSDFWRLALCHRPCVGCCVWLLIISGNVDTQTFIYAVVTFCKRVRPLGPPPQKPGYQTRLAGVHVWDSAQLGHT